MAHPKTIYLLLLLFAANINASDQLTVFLCCASWSCGQHKASWLASSVINIRDSYVLMKEEDKKALLPAFSQLGEIIPQHCWLINNLDVRQKVFEYINALKSGDIDSHTKITSGLAGGFNFYYINNHSFMHNGADSNKKRDLLVTALTGVAVATVVVVQDVAIRTLLSHPAGWGTFAVGGGIYYSYPFIKDYWATRKRRVTGPAYPFGMPR